MSQISSELVREIEEQSQSLRRLREEVAKVLVGQQYMVDRLLLALIADGHVLIEGVPGLAKTTAIKTVARAVDVDFSRVQFTPDLLPADLVGTQIYQPSTGQFTVKKGPVFTNFLLADEINRAPAKVQSALLESMAERQVTLGDRTFELAQPFLVLATQNPIEQEGTYPLPEAQVDRFMLKLKVGYPDKVEEKEIMRRMSRRDQPTVEAVMTRDDIIQARQIADQIYVDEKVEDYIVEVVFATREPRAHGLEHLADLIEYGASPRATIYLNQAAKVRAFLAGRGYVTPQDVKDIGPDVLRHRVIVSYEAEARDMTSDDVVQEVFNTVDVP
ncbi:MAG: MoxR family ATPase [Proteobacteria bacterium]|jgi:MoxR-like ATPase|nr:MoxR family ATPase [Pseudomonadota bacterium]